MATIPSASVALLGRKDALDLGGVDLRDQSRCARVV